MTEKADSTESEKLKETDANVENERSGSANKIRCELKEANAKLEEFKNYVEQTESEISVNKAEIARLKSRVGFHDWIDRFYGRVFAFFVALIAVCFLYGTISKILRTDVTSYFFESTTTETPVADGKQLKSDTATNATKTTDSKAEESKANPTKKTTTTHIELAWLYALKLFGSIAVFYALLWAILALVRSDQRD